MSERMALRFETYVEIWLLGAFLCTELVNHQGRRASPNHSLRLLPFFGILLFFFLKGSNYKRMTYNQITEPVL
jgi:hypothetical protein